jgi:hypothetical protein
MPQSYKTTSGYVHWPFLVECQGPRESPLQQRPCDRAVAPTEPPGSVLVTVLLGWPLLKGRLSRVSGTQPQQHQRTTSGYKWGPLPTLAEWLSVESLGSSAKEQESRHSKSDTSGEV